MTRAVSLPWSSRLSLERVAAALILGLGGVGLLATLGWALGTIATRPLDNVEGEILFEAARIRERLPLYVDPGVGAPYPGSLVPSRYYVLYLPVWPALLSLVPAPAAFLVARIVATLAWFGTLARAIAIAPPARRQVVLAFALIFGGAWVLALHGASGKPDAIAVAVAGAAVLRSVRRGGADVIAGILFVLAFSLKPNVIGAAPGVLLASAWLARDRRARLLAPFAGAAAALLVLVVGLTVAAGSSVWIDHLLASTGQSPMFALWKQQIAARGPFFLLPLVGALVYGALQPTAGARIATCALATSLAWSFLCLAKIGSASNYFLEPGVVAVTLVACVGSRPIPRLALAVAGVVQMAWISVASVRSALEESASARARADLVAQARATCGAGPGTSIVSDEPGIELMLDGRILGTPFQTTHLVRRGRFDAGVWERDLAQPEIACALLSNRLLEQARPDPIHDRFPPEIVRVLRERFTFVTSAGGYRLYRLRG